MKQEHDDAYANGRFSSCGFDKYSYHSAAEAAGMMATGIRLHSFHLQLGGLTDGTNALHKMCMDNEPAIVSLLIKQGGLAVNGGDVFWPLPAVLAAKDGHVEVVRALLALDGVAANQAVDDGVTALFVAAQRGHVEVERLLQERLAKRGLLTSDF